MLPNQKPDLLKIIFFGIPILLIFWAVVFVFLAFFTKDMNITKYGAFALFLPSIPTYGYLAIKNASKLKAVLHEDEEKIRSGETQQTGRKKYLTYLDLWLAGGIVLILIASIFICEIILGIKSDKISKYIMLAIPVVVLIDVVIKSCDQTSNVLKTNNRYVICRSTLLL